MKEIDKRIQEVKEQHTKLSKEIEVLEALALKEKEEKEFKENDWVIWSGVNPTIGRIDKPDGMNWGVDGVSYILKDHAGKGKYTSCSQKYLRKATPEEIEKHLISEAEKKGFVKGAKVVSIAHGGEASIIGNLFLYRDITKFFPNASASYYGEVKQDAICVNYSCHRGWDFLEKIKPLPSTPQISIGTNKVSFFNDHITIGCKTVSKDSILKFNAAMQQWNDKNKELPISNFNIQGYEVDGGDLEKIAEHFEERNKI